MAAPTAPTIATIATEALAKAGYGDVTVNPGLAVYNRAIDEWAREIKSDIYRKAKKLTTLQQTAVIILAEGQSKYPNPSDFYADNGMKLLYGDVTGTAQAGSSSTVTLAAAETIAEGTIVGKWILITSGTGEASYSQCTAYNESTKVATVKPNFATAPASGSGYMIVDYTPDLRPSTSWVFDKESDPYTTGEPTHYIPMGDADSGEFQIYPPPDKTYGLLKRYYLNINTLDLAGTLMGSLLQECYDIFDQGIYARALKNDNDEREEKEMMLYRQKIADLVAMETYGSQDLPDMQMTIQDD